MTAAVLAAGRLRPGDQVIELGCGDGRLSLALAEQGAAVLAIDVGHAALAALLQVARERMLPGFSVLAAPIEDLTLPERSADLVVSCYALHRLRDADKARLVAAAYRWLRPGGMLLVADMMFGRGGTSRDRAIIRSKVRSLARKGIGGWWRIAKNGYRYLIRAKEHPIPITGWTAILARAGFTAITASSIVNEAGLVTGRRPEDPAPPENPALPEDPAPPGEPAPA